MRAFDRTTGILLCAAGTLVVWVGVSLGTELPPQTRVQLPTVTPKPYRTPTRPYLPTVTPKPNAEGTPWPFVPCGCAYDAYNCADFSSVEAAQTCFNFCIDQTGADVHHLVQDYPWDAYTYSGWTCLSEER